MSSSTCVYVSDKIHGWLPANVLSSNETTAKVRVTIPALVEYGKDNTISEAEETKEIELPVKEIESLPLQNVDANGNMMEMEDMVDLPSLTEAAILANLMARHVKDMPYTKIGDIVIAMNPFKWLKDIYSEENRERYANALVWDVKPGVTPPRLPPHVYATSSSAFRGLAVDGVDQSILVSGESGAGKTETVKIVMSHLAAIQSSGSDGGSSGIVKRVLDSNPLLEAFGNAKTVRNDNSSRFGKYIQLEFDVEDATSASFKGRAVPTCTLAGSRCETYLLEKSRIVGHEPEERGYHIFYQVLDSPKEYKASLWSELSDLDGTSFKYIGHTDTTVIEGRTDGETWQRTSDALSTVGIAGDTLSILMRAVVIVMQLGNLTFGPDPTNEDNSIITSDDELAKLAGLMGVSSDDVKAALTIRTVVAGKEVYKVPLNATDAKDSCDAFAKEIYQQIFDWLVTKINEATCAELNYAEASEVSEFGIVGLLDIFGFESFKINRFEQLCINYTNEKLQRKYTTDIFQSVQDEYEYEGIELCDLAYEDNSDVLNLIEGRMGLIAVLNEECVRPRGNDSAFVSKIKTMNKDVDCLIQEKLHRPTEFGINHYAGPVKYDASFFVKKNMDSIPRDLLDCAEKCTNNLISVELKRAAEAKESSEQKSTGRGRKAAMTISTKFRGELNSLMSSIESTRTRYIRCIKPNKAKKPKIVNMTSAMDQLRCAGVVAAVSISRAAFPNRLTHEVALERFMCLTDGIDTVNEEKKVDDDSSGLRGKVEEVMSFLLKAQETVKDGETVKAYVCGKTRIYFLAGALEYLESERLLALGDRSVIIQRFVRGFVARSKFLTLKDAAINSQAFVRYAIARKAFVRLRAASLILACWTRCNMAKAELLRRQKNKACTQIQLKWRRARDMAMLKSCVSSAIIVQKILRGSIQRPIYRAMLAQAAEDAKIENQLKILQRKLAEAEARRKEEEKRRIDAEKKIAAGAGGGTIPQAAIISDGEEKKMDGPTAEQQEALIHESGEMLEYMRKEIFNLRSKNYLLRTDLNQLKSDHKTLSETHQSTVSNFEALNIHAHQVAHENLLLATKVADLKKEMKVIKNELNVSRLLQKAEKKQFKEEQQKLRDDHREEIERQKAEMERHTRSQAVLSRYRQSYQQPTTKGRVASPVPQGRQRWYNDDDSTERSVERRSEKKKSLQALRMGSGSNHSSRQLPRVSSKLKIQSSADVPEGAWDRKGFEELSKETPTNNRRRSRRGSQSNRSSKSNTPRGSRPGTPNSLSSSASSPAASSLAAASSLKRASTKKNTR